MSDETLIVIDGNKEFDDFLKQKKVDKPNSFFRLPLSNEKTKEVRLYNISKPNWKNEFCLHDNVFVVKIINCNFDTIKFALYDGGEAVIEIKNTEFSTLFVDNRKKDQLMFAVKDCLKVGDIFKDPRVYNSLTIENSVFDKGAHLIFHDSAEIETQNKPSLLTTELINVDFSNGGGILLSENVSLAESTVHNCKFKTEDHNLRFSIDLRKQYCKWKNEALSINNHIQALNFLKLEMEVQKNILKKENKHWYNDADALIFTANETFSDHGTDFVKPMFYFLFFGIASYLFVAFLEGEQFLINNALIFIFDITQKFDHYTLPGSTLVHIVWKILYAYLLYNMLLGFRKYSRKL